MPTTQKTHMNEFLISILNGFGLAWWVEIKTEKPQCTYYFGPFLTAKTAKAAQGGYLEDLEQEGAQGIVINIKRCKPTHLTISDDLGEHGSRRKAPIFSGQL